MINFHSNEPNLISQFQIAGFWDLFEEPPGGVKSSTTNNKLISPKLVLKAHNFDLGT